MSITSIILLLERISKIRKPCRILYVSDFDPAGMSMPVQVARNIEFFINEYVEKGLITEDIKLNPVILTSEQVAYYSLPKIPIKETDKRKGNFEAIHGEGAVELDALEALHPEELGKIIEDNIMQFYDVELVDKVQSAKKEADRRIQMRYSERIEHYKAREQELKKRG